MKQFFSRTTGKPIEKAHDSKSGLSVAKRLGAQLRTMRTMSTEYGKAPTVYKPMDLLQYNTENKWWDYYLEDDHPYWGAYLIYIPPNTVSEFHTHQGWETILVLSGELIETEFSPAPGLVLSVGDMARFPPGSSHSSYTPASTPCLVLAWDLPESYSTLPTPPQSRQAMRTTNKQDNALYWCCL